MNPQLKNDITEFLFEILPSDTPLDDVQQAREGFIKVIESITPVEPREPNERYSDFVEEDNGK